LNYSPLGVNTVADKKQLTKCKVINIARIHPRKQVETSEIVCGALPRTGRRDLKQDGETEAGTYISQNAVIDAVVQSAESADFRSHSGHPTSSLFFSFFKISAIQPPNKGDRLI